MFTYLINKHERNKMCATLYKTGQLKKILFILSAFLISCPVYSQTTGTATLNVTLVDVLQLTVNTASATLNFATSANYTNGVTTTVSNQLSVFSSRPYGLQVRASSTTLSNAGSYSIPVNNISIAPTGTTGIGTTSTLSLSNTDQTFASVAPATLGKNISMQYSTAAGNTAFLIPGGTFSSTLTFTIVAN